MGPIWGRQDPGGPHVGPMNFVTWDVFKWIFFHYSDVIMSVMVSPITGISIVYPPVCSDIDQSKHQSCTSLVFVREIHWWPLNSPHKGPITQKMFPFDDVIIFNENVWISIRISLKFVPKVPRDNKPSLVQIMAWWRPGNKPLSEPIMV